MGDKERAIEEFQAVADMRWADYEWVFQGNIQQAMTYERRNGNSDAIVELLEDMLDDKRTRPTSTKCTSRWVRWPSRTAAATNPSTCSNLRWRRTWTMSTNWAKGYLKLADLYMEDLVYPTAQAYYDSALVYIDEDNERKDEISSLASDLSSLVENLNVISEVDSLFNLCDMDEDLRLGRWTACCATWNWSFSVCGTSARRPKLQPLRPPLRTTRVRGCFGPTTDNCVNRQQTFLSYWGDRVLEDNWRRANKLGNLFSEDEESGDGRRG